MTIYNEMCMTAFTKSIMMQEVVNGKTVTLTKKTSVHDKDVFTFWINVEGEKNATVCNMEGEAKIYFLMVMDEIRDGVR